MALTPSRTEPHEDEEPPPDEMGHPRGTLAIVILYAVLLALGWLAMYFTFLGRGAPRP